jgi:hypothetical protein
MLLRITLHCVLLTFLCHSLDGFFDLFLGVALDLAQATESRQSGVGPFRVGGFRFVELSPRVRHATHFNDTQRVNLIVGGTGVRLQNCFERR